MPKTFLAQAHAGEPKQGRFFLFFCKVMFAMGTDLKTKGAGAKKQGGPAQSFFFPWRWLPGATFQAPSCTGSLGLRNLSMSLQLCMPGAFSDGLSEILSHFILKGV